MKIKAINIKKFDSLNMFGDREVKGAILLISLFAAGMILGAGMWRSGNQNSQIILNILNDFIAVRNVNSVFTIFINALLFNTIFLIIIIAFGFSSIGSIFVFMIPMIRGVGYGILSGYLYSNFLMNGIGYYLLTVFPSAVLYNSIIILAANNACFLSMDILSVIIGKKQADISILRNNIKTNIIYSVFIVVATMTECITIKAFAYLFRF